MPIISERGGLWADTLDPIVKFRFDQAFNRRASLLATMFNVQTSNRAYEQISGVGAIGVDSWNHYGATAANGSGQVPEVDFDQGYKQTYTHKEFVVDLPVERKTIDDQQQGDVFRAAERLGDSAALKRETDAASVFNNAFSSSFVGGDGVALCSASHPFSPQKTGVVQSNTGTSALTKANVSTVREAMMAFTDDNGNKMGVTPNIILVPPALEDEALEISKSLLDPTSANNTINVHAGRFQIVTWHYLSDSNNWFMIDSTMMKMSLDWFDRVPLSVKMRMGDDPTLKVYWRAYMRYSFGFSNWMWVYGNNVA
jgi:hypothetical protein